MTEKTTVLSRRNFLRNAGIAAGTLVVTSTLPSFNAVLYAAVKRNTKGPWYGIAIDIEKCIGCGNCAKTCKIENDVPREPFFYRSWVEQYTIRKDGSLKVVSPNGGIDGFKQSVPTEEIEKSFFVPKMCNHCSKSPCVQVCPVGATYETEEGIVLVDEKYCIGCKYCVQACPYGCRYFHPDKHVVDKCTLCFHRIKKGLNPACMDNCPTKARISGDLNDPESEISKFIRTKNVYVLKPHLNTGSKLYYNALNQEVR